jgi:hypothetical protein
MRSKGVRNSIGLAFHPMEFLTPYSPFLIPPTNYFGAIISLEKILFTIRHSPPYFTSDM